jgi:predicted ArsR family transcriptional regulator
MSANTHDAGRQRLCAVLAVAPCTVGQAAAAANLHGNTVRVLLDELASAGRVVRERAGGQYGRPRFVYRLLAAGTVAARSPARTRPCLCCDKAFHSEGFGNRLCNTCRKLDVSPFALAV